MIPEFLHRLNFNVYHQQDLSGGAGMPNIKQNIIRHPSVSRRRVFGINTHKFAVSVWRIRINSLAVKLIDILNTFLKLRNRIFGKFLNSVFENVRQNNFMLDETLRNGIVRVPDFPALLRSTCS